MADDTADLEILVVFKSGPSERYQISAKELDRLSLDFYNSNSKQVTRTYTVFQNDQPRVLMLNFADVLYIG